MKIHLSTSSWEKKKTKPGIPFWNQNFLFNNLFIFQYSKITNGVIIDFHEYNSLNIFLKSQQITRSSAISPSEPHLPQQASPALLAVAVIPGYLRICFLIKTF